MSQELSAEDLFEMVGRAANDVFSTMLGLQLNAGTPFVATEGKSPGAGVVSLIGFAGPWIGTGSIACSPKMACLSGGALLGSEYSVVEDEVLDAVAEITNMILGNVKTELEERLGPMLLSVPTVIYGRNFTTRSLIKHNWVIVPFSYEGEPFDIRLCLSKNSDTNTTAGLTCGYALHI